MCDFCKDSLINYLGIVVHRSDDYGQWSHKVSNWAAVFK